MTSLAYRAPLIALATMSLTITAAVSVAVTTSSAAGAADPVYETVDQISNNGFEASSPVCFTPSSASDGAVAITTNRPLAGAQSLAVTVNPWSRVTCAHDYPFAEGPIGKTVTAQADLRIDAPASSPDALTVCTIVYYEDAQDPQRTCSDLHPAGGQVVHVNLPQDAAGRRVARVFFQFETGNTGMQATLDNAHLLVEQVQGSTGPRDGGGGDGGGGDGGGGGGGGAECDPSTEPIPNGPPDPSSPCDLNEVPSATSVYHPATLQLPSSRPFISLADYTRASATSPIGTAFKAYVDRAAINHNPDSGYTPADGVVMFARTGDTRYIDDSIARVDAQVSAEEARIASTHDPLIDNDDSLLIGEMIEQIALTYDWGFNRLTDNQKQRWSAYADKAISNLWSQPLATWSSATGASTGRSWAINDPGNNYFYSFLQATEWWALATHNSAWMNFLQQWKFPLLEDYFAQITGGGSREGTGYGTAQRRLWEDARIWRESTGENLPKVMAHARASVDFWIHATVPTLNFYAPVGDVSRQSVPELYDYQENLVREAALDSPGTPEANRALWWITHNSVPDTMSQSFNLRDALLQPTGTATAPTALTYHAPGVGELFARSSWNTDATWLNVIAGPFDQSHAHHEQGGFTLYRNDWQSVTSNIWSHSGLQGVGGHNPYLGVEATNVLRFDSSSGTIPQNEGTNSLTVDTSTPGTVRAHAALNAAYADHADQVQSWSRDFTLTGNQLSVHDSCSVAAGVTPVFQLHVPTQPSVSGTTITAGKLTVTVPSTYRVTSVAMNSVDSDFASGWRLNITNPAGCAFDVSMTAGA